MKYKNNNWEKVREHFNNTTNTTEGTDEQKSKKI